MSRAAGSAGESAPGGDEPGRTDPEDPLGDPDPVRDPSDADLLAAHVAGDPDAFGTLFLRHRDRLWAVAVRTMGDREEAADALQEAMISASRRAGTFRGDAAVTSWLHRIVVNSCLDLIRRNRVRRTDPLHPGADRDLGLVAAEDPTRRIESAELATIVEQALSRLNADQRAALVLVDMEQLSVAEAAVELGVPQGTVKSRCARGRTRLAELLAPFRDSF